MPMSTKMKMTELGQIPIDWDVLEVKSLCKVNGRIGFRGYTTADLVPAGQGALAIGGKHITHCVLDLSDPDYISWDKYYESPEIMVKQGDIVLAQRGSLGKAAFIDREIGPATINPSLVLLNSIRCSAQYLFYYLISEPVISKILSETGQTSIPMISQRQVEGIKVALPHISEQEHIAQALGDIDHCLVSFEKLIKKKRLIKLGAMQSLLTGRIRLKGFNHPWIEVELKDTGLMKSGGTPSTLVPEYWNGNINWLQSGAVQNCYIYPSAVSQKITELGLSKSAAYLISHDSVLIALTGATCANVGYLTFDSAANQSVVSIEPYPDYSAKFLYQLLLTKRDLILQNRGGSAQGGVTLNQLKGITVTLPRDLEEQVEIAAILSAMDNEIAALEAERDKYKNIKQGMMQKLLTGQIRLPV